MKMATFLVYKTLLPFVAVGCVFLSIFLYRTLDATRLLPLALMPGAGGVILLFWFFHTYGYCPNCHRHLGKNIGKNCKNGGYALSGQDRVSKRSH